MKKINIFFLLVLMLVNSFSSFAKEFYIEEPLYKPLPDYEGEWVNFRSNDENMGITNAHTPRNENEIDFKWGVKHSHSYKESVTPPIIVNDNLYIAKGDRVLILDKYTGEEIISSQPLMGEVGYALNPVTYGEGMIFVPISKGRIQALRADTLESLWVSREMGGQSLTPVTYKNGFVFSGCWSGEEKEGRYYCLDVTDEDNEQTDEEKEPLWEIAHKGGFYWAGAYANDDFVVFGGDDGKKGYDSVGSSLYSVNITDGSIVDVIGGIKGDIRSSVSFDINTSYLYFASKCGDFHRVILNDDGTFDHLTHNYINVGNMTTSTPIIYNNLGFVGVCGEGQFSSEGHKYVILDVSEENMTVFCEENVPGYVQTSALLSVSYEADFNKLYLYLTYNSEPGGIYVIEVKNSPGKVSARGSNLFLPTDDMSGYCVCSLVCDYDGNIYYKNDSGYLLCVGKSETYDYYSEVDEAEFLRQEHLMKLDLCLEECVLADEEEKLYDEIIQIYDEAQNKLYEIEDEEEMTKAVLEYISKMKKIIFSKENIFSKDIALEQTKENRAIFLDIEDSPYKESIEKMYFLGIVKGINENEFMPRKKVTRAEFVEFLFRLSNEKNKSTDINFVDVNKSDWFYDSVIWAVNSNIVKGVSESEFMPDAYVTNEQTAVLVSRYITYMGYTFKTEDFNMKLYEYEGISDWAISDVMFVTGYGIVPTVKGSIKPDSNSLREEVCNILNNLTECVQNGD